MSVLCIRYGHFYQLRPLMELEQCLACHWLREPVGLKVKL